MKIVYLIILLAVFPTAAFALEQSFTQQGLKTAISLTPEKLEPRSEVQLRLALSKDGAAVTDKDVTLEVYERDAAKPVIKHQVDVLDGEYVDSWQFEKPGDYKVVVLIGDHGTSGGLLRYEINASVIDPSKEQHDEGFFAHHFGGHWGWWGAGLMVVMMIPMMILL